MFNFFNEIKNKYKNLENKLAPFQCVMLGNFLLYVEGFKSLISYTDDLVVFKVKEGVITVSGENLFLKEMSCGTITIEGKIKSMECL